MLLNSTKIEQVIEVEIRRILSMLGIPKIEIDTPMEAVKRQMEIAGINIIKQEYVFDKHLSGWYIYQHGFLIIAISEPTVTMKGEVKIRRMLPKDKVPMPVMAAEHLA